MAAPLKIKITMREDLVTVRTHGRIMWTVHQRIAAWHKSNNTIRHFANNEDTRPGGGYGYATRGQRYAFRKQKRVGHRIPNVYSGRMRSTVMSSSYTAQTQHKWTFKARNYFKMRAAQRAELEAVSPREIKEFVRRMGVDYVRLCMMPQNRRQRKTKIK